MRKQTITIQLSDDPFDTEEVTVNLPNNVKLMNTEPYAIERLKDYGIDINNIKDTDNKSNILDYKIVEGCIYEIYEDHALIDVGSKYTAICNLSKEDDEIIKQLKPGLNVHVKIKQNKKGEIIASISDAINEVHRKDIYNSIDDDSVGYKCKIEELINGGYWVRISGVKCFLPGSLAGLNKIYNFNELIDKELIVMPIAYDRRKNSIIVSHRKYLKTLQDDAIVELKANLDHKITGKVTGTTNFGVFVEFNKCLTCLIPKDELKDSLSDFNSKLIKPNDEIDFWVKDIINKNKIISSQKKSYKDPWDDIENKYKHMQVVTGKITRKTDYGIFIKLEKGISGLLHKSKTGNMKFDKGENINVLIESVNPTERRISMSLPRK